MTCLCGWGNGVFVGGFWCVFFVMFVLAAVAVGVAVCGVVG